MLSIVNKCFQKNNRPRTAIYALVFLIVIYYFLNGYFLGSRTDPEDRSKDNYYSRLTTALLAGHFYLLEKPSPEFLALPNPYDPKQNVAYRIGPPRHHDISFYKDKLYVYFGITPVFILWLPVRLLGINMISAIAVPIFCSVAFLIALAFLRTIMHQAKLQISNKMWVISILAVAFNSSIPYLLRRSNIYETAVSAAYLCAMLAFYFFASAFSQKQINGRKLFLGSLFLGLTVGARPNFIILGILLPCLSILILKHFMHDDWKLTIKKQLALWIPYVAVGVFLALYNYSRFGSFTEFGNHYQLSGVPLQIASHQWSIDLLKPNLYFYVWQGLTLNWVYPYFHVLPLYPALLPAFYYGPEPVTGIFSLAPILWILIFFPIAMIKFTQYEVEYSKLPLWISGGLLFFGCTELAIISFNMPSATMRYLVDFLPYFILAALLFCYTINAKFVRLKWFKLRKICNIFIIGAILYGTIANIAIGASGYFNDPNPKLKKVFGWIETVHNHITEKNKLLERK